MMENIWPTLGHSGCFYAITCSIECLPKWTDVNQAFPNQVNIEHCAEQSSVNARHVIP